MKGSTPPEKSQIHMEFKPGKNSYKENVSAFFGACSGPTAVINTIRKS